MCEYCGAKDGCQPTGKELRLAGNLTAEDWKKIHQFYKYVILPFLHGVVVDANRREQKQRAAIRALKDAP